MSRKTIILMIALLGLFFITGCHFITGLAMSPREEKIIFYGRVIDQFDNPVEKATVVIGVKYYDPFAELPGLGAKTINLKTDSDGLFTLKDKGWDIHIRMITKDSYEFLRDDTIRSYSYEKREKYYIPNPDKPVVFHMHKK